MLQDTTSDTSSPPATGLPAGGERLLGRRAVIAIMAGYSIDFQRLALFRAQIDRPYDAVGSERCLVGQSFPSKRIGVEQFGARGDGVIDSTAAFQAALSSGRELSIGPGVFVLGPLKIPSNTRLRGAGAGRSIIRLKSGSDTTFIRAGDGANDIHGIEMLDFTLDGNARGQARLANGMVLQRLRGGIFNIAVTNCRGSGLVISGGGGNWFGSGMHVYANGMLDAGYGLYLFSTDDNHVQGGRYDNNCIGIAIEASGANSHSRRNVVDSPTCEGNRADFGQSGAGVHFEQSLGGDCNDCRLINPTCFGSTGVGINNTGCNLTLLSGRCFDNAESAITTIAARSFRYDGLVCRNNALGRSTGYKGEMRFDDSGLIPGSSGTVQNCSLRGRSADGGIRTMSKNSMIAFVKNDVAGYDAPYIISGTGDTVDGSRRARPGVYFL